VHDRRPREPDAEVLSDPVAERLLARASELDAAHGAGAAVDDLRAAAAEAGISAGAFVVMLSRTPTDAVAGAAAPMVEEAFVLRCLSPGEAAELVRPLLHLPTNTVIYSPTHAPRVLTIRDGGTDTERAVGARPA
jgi:hypothetical protein